MDTFRILSFPQVFRAAAAWLKAPAGGVAVLIFATFLARLLFASALGLGVDESYMVAVGRKLQLSYFDHPPIAWWMAWAAAHLTGSEGPVVVRLPFIALFAVTTFLMYRLTSALFSSEAPRYGGGRHQVGTVADLLPFECLVFGPPSWRAFHGPD